MHENRPDWLTSLIDRLRTETGSALLLAGVALIAGRTTVEFLPLDPPGEDAVEAGEERVLRHRAAHVPERPGARPVASRGHLLNPGRA